MPTEFFRRLIFLPFILSDKGRGGCKTATSPFGRGDGIRTHDLMVPNHTRYQLRYASSSPQTPLKCTFITKSAKVASLRLLFVQNLAKQSFARYLTNNANSAQTRFCLRLNYYIILKRRQSIKLPPFSKIKLFFFTVRIFVCVYLVSFRSGGGLGEFLKNFYFLSRIACRNFVFVHNRSVDKYISKFFN